MEQTEALRSAMAKQEQLQAILRKLGRVAVAFSSGVDSTYLLYIAYQTLGDNVLAVTARSCSFPPREMREAQSFTTQYGIRHLFCDTEELEVPGFADNPPHRCYLCKRHLFEQMRALARAQGIACVAEGSNMDDLGDYRPGLKAIDELGIVSPLRQAGLTKAEIRLLSRQAGLPTWSKPSYACLASRFPYGERITREKLAQIDRAEQCLMDLGFAQLRVRHHGKLARIEVEQAALTKMLEENTRQKIVEGLHAAGFTYVTMDLEGYRMGSMNVGLEIKGEKHGEAYLPGDR